MGLTATNKPRFGGGALNTYYDATFIVRGNISFAHNRGNDGSVCGGLVGGTVEFYDGIRYRPSSCSHCLDFVC
jgi:hypothetical protein